LNHALFCIKCKKKHSLKKTVLSAKSFNALVSLVLQELDSKGMLDTAVENSGKIFISTELGGGGFVSPETLKIAENGIRNLLRHLEILPPDEEPFPETRFMLTPDFSGYLIAQQEGLYETLLELGESVTKGANHRPHSQFNSNRSSRAGSSCANRQYASRTSRSCSSQSLGYDCRDCY
jgi:predicted deacylase